MNVHLYAWVITVVVTIAVLVVDVVIIGRRPHEPSMKEAGSFIGMYVAMAVLFGIGVWMVSGADYGKQFFAGWLTEYSLSIDNLFIFVIIMTKMKVPRHLQQFALMVGIILALVFRAVFIALGAAVIDRFAAVFFLFGGYLIYTAIKLFVEWLKGDDDEEEAKDGLFVRLIRRSFPSTRDFRGVKLTVSDDGKRLLTPMFFVILALGTTDLIFALDSIPAIYGLTQEPFLVFTANVFALMGLRQLYFLIGGLLKRLIYLSVGLSVVLVFIGVKLMLHAFHETHVLEWIGYHGPVPEVSTELSLGVIVTTLVITTVASLIRTRGKSAADLTSAEPSDGEEFPDYRAPKD